VKYISIIQSDSNMSIIESLKDSFNFEGKKLRVYGNADEPWFCGKDVALILGYKDTSKSLRDNIDTDDKTIFDNLIGKVGVFDPHPKTFNKNELKTIYINESGLYSLILRSKLAGAKKFKKWVTKTVLPSIRKQGFYLAKDIQSREIKKLRDELEHQQSCNIVLKNYVTNVKQRLKKEIIYIATTKSYANQNNFKVGGCSNRKLLKKRLSTYNTGRPDADKYYFSYIEETPSFRQLEKRIKDLLGEFRDSKNKEVYVINYNSLKCFVNLLKNNYDEEIKEFNELIKTFAEDLVNKKAVVPEAIKLDCAELTIIKNGEVIESKFIDLFGLSDSEQEKTIKKLLMDFDKTLNKAATVNRKDFETFAKEKKYKFKSREFWKKLKQLFEPSQKMLAIKY